MHRDGQQETHTVLTMFQSVPSWFGQGWYLVPEFIVPCLVPSAVQSRPFGVALLIAGWDEIGPVL